MFFDNLVKHVAIIAKLTSFQLNNMRLPSNRWRVNDKLSYLDNHEYMNTQICIVFLLNHFVKMMKIQKLSAHNCVTPVAL